MNIDFEILKKYSSSDEGLRDYQQDNKIKVYEAWEKVQSVMLQMPTGTGKTRLFVSIIRFSLHNILMSGIISYFNLSLLS